MLPGREVLAGEQRQRGPMHGPYFGQLVGREPSRVPHEGMEEALDLGVPPLPGVEPSEFELDGLAALESALQPPRLGIAQGSRTTRSPTWRVVMR